MRIRVKSQEHINLDGLTPGELSIIMQGLELIRAKGNEDGNHVTFGFAHNVISEISDALDKVGNIIQGPAKEARRKRKLDEAAALREKSGVDGIMAKCREELASLDTAEEESSGDVIVGSPDPDRETAILLFKEENGREPSESEISELVSADHCD